MSWRSSSDAEALSTTGGSGLGQWSRRKEGRPRLRWESPWLDLAGSSWRDRARRSTLFASLDGVHPRGGTGKQPPIPLWLALEGKAGRHRLSPPSLRVPSSSRSSISSSFDLPNSERRRFSCAHRCSPRTLEGATLKSVPRAPGGAPPRNDRFGGSPQHLVMLVGVVLRRSWRH